jgi:2-isopropylmalate synthase
MSEAMVKFWRPNALEPEFAADHGSGPVNALDRALRKLLLPSVGSEALKRVELRDYRVRVVEGTDGTAAAVRVVIESGLLPNGETDLTTWSTVGCSTNIIEASWQALVDSYEYWMCRHAS